MFRGVNLDVHIGQEKINRVKTFKYLGITMDETLTYNIHINNIIKKVNHKISMLKRICKYLTVKTSVLIYKSFILPILEYGSILYMNASKSHLDRLQTLQNHGLKCCLNVNKRTHTSLIHKKLI